MNNPIPFILFTGKGGNEIAYRARRLGANFYIVKGKDIKERYNALLSAIQSCIGVNNKEIRVI